MRLTKGISGLVGATCAAAAALLASNDANPVWLDGFLFDGALAVRSRLIEPPQPASKVAVVAIDPVSLDSDELKNLPRTFFGPVWGALITGLDQAGAKVVAVDFLLSYSASQFQRDYDRPFLAALYRNRTKVVLGRSTRGTPARNYMAALRNDPGSLGGMEIEPSGDAIHRWVPSSIRLNDGKELPTLAGAALRRSAVQEIPATVLFAPAAHPEDFIPTYRLIDVLNCSKSDPDALKRAFAGRAVFVGSTLPEEDRKRASSRFIKSAQSRQPALSSCGLAPLNASVPKSANIPGVFLHAVAAENVLNDRLTVPLSQPWTTALTAIAALAGAAIGFALAPVWAIGAVVVGAAAIWVGEIALLGSGLWFKAGLAVVSIGAAAMLAYLVRLVLEEGKRRRIQKAFGYYLAPALVDQLVDTAEGLRLGGETRDVTVMFADLSGFTALSGKVGPAELVKRTNEYLTLIADEVEATGGYVDKFIGDAVMAVWGAPVALEDHALQGVKAAIRISDRIADAHARATAAGEHGFAVKIGVNTGDAVVGNVGSEKRFNYTAVGEAVNIAARLEGLPGVYDCRIILGETTASRVADLYELRELDRVAVKGKAEPLPIFEPVETAGQAAAYGGALALYRAGEFSEAAEQWQRIGDGPSTVMAERARTFLRSPPGDSWDGVWVMSTK